MERNSFVELLKSFRSKKFYLSAAPGNSGDQLLQKGLSYYLVANQYTVVDTPEAADVICIHGGANINDIWKVGIEHFFSLAQTYPHKTLIVAPHTFEFWETDFASRLSKLSQPIYLFAREQSSYAYLQSLSTKENVAVDIADDTAFLLAGTEYIAQLQEGCTNAYVLCAMRTDRESAFVPLDLDRPPQNIYEAIKLKIINFYLRRKLRPVLCHSDRKKQTVLQDISYLPYSDFVSKVQHASEIHTDRLHVGILGALLNKPVFLYRTRYDKVTGVYAQSLRAYTNVTPMFDV